MDPTFAPALAKVTDELVKSWAEIEFCINRNICIREMMHNLDNVPEVKKIYNALYDTIMARPQPQGTPCLSVPADIAYYHLTYITDRLRKNIGEYEAKGLAKKDKEFKCNCKEPAPESPLDELMKIAQKHGMTVVHLG